MRFGSLILCALAFGLAGAARAEPVRTPHVTAELIGEDSSVAPGGVAWVGLRFELKPEWHTYWEFPGDSGLPTQLEWRLPEGWAASPIQWPLPKRILLPPLVNFGYDGEVLHVVRVAVPGNAKSGAYELRAKASWLVCKEECIPEKADLTYVVQVGKGNAKKNRGAHLFERVRGEQAHPFSEAERPRVSVDGANVRLAFPASFGDRLDGADFFPLVGQVVTGQAPPRREGNLLWLDKAEPFQGERLRGVLITGKGTARVIYSVDEPLTGEPDAAVVASALPNAPATSPADFSLWLSLVFAFLGGLFLNLMPCVFPVLTIKVMSLLQHQRESAWKIRWQGKAYALGVLVSFWILTAILLGLRSAGQAVGWGFQLQEPAFVIALVLLFTLIAWNLAGSFEIGGRWMGIGHRLASSDGATGAFFTGVLAVVVATPCTAPFMGSAIGVAIAQPAVLVVSVFTALGLGLAAPFVLFAYWPRLIHALPKPGAWMSTLKEFFAFPMLATVLWLLWVLGKQIGLDGAILVAFGALLLSLAIWWGARSRSGAGQAFALLLALLAAGVAFYPTTFSPVSSSTGEKSGWAPFSEAAVAEALKAGHPVFVDFTAAWCLTCQVNKRLVLDRAPMREFFRDKGVRLFLADWTNHDPAITAALARHGRIGVPVYLAYRAGAAKPEILPQILTPEIVRRAFP